MFNKVSNQASFPEMEKRILEFWNKNKIYDRSLEQRKDGPKFVFFEGPPTANGMPHPGHCLTRAIKDLFPRYRTMRGDYCRRKAGWDTHGLPVEVEVCKELGIHSKEQIEEYGVEPFIQKCQQSVWRYMKRWEELTQRLGFWLHTDSAYVTYHQSYVESVWWSLKTLFDNGDLYQGHKIVWWWAQGGTALSSGEVGEGYKEVADPSAYVLFPLVDDPGTHLLVWTTTPWTLPSNQFVAVGPDVSYATVTDSDSRKKIIVAEDLVEKLAGKKKCELVVESTCKGSDLLGKRYRPCFDYFYNEYGNKTGTKTDGTEEHLYWTVLPADFVTTSSGTGLVHQAPAFGEVDHEVLVTRQEEFETGQGPELFCPVGPDGKFTDQVSDLHGTWVKEADKPLIRKMKESGSLWFQEQYLHDYPFCWRADKDPLIQYPRHSWFIKTTKYRDQMLANNQEINWLPDHIKNGRFGNFLEDNVDWALSRERFWGTPLPIWVCSETGKQEAVGQYEELLEKPGVSGQEVWLKAKEENPELPDDLRVHKPYIDAVEYDSPFAEGGRMKRVTEVIDCWYDSGAMPFAQWGYPHQGTEEFASQFPANFISEAIDQTRGWFYSLTAISTMLFGKDSPLSESQKELIKDYPHPFKNCIVLGLMLSEWWTDKEENGMALTIEDAKEQFGKNAVHHVGKMSKQKRNYREPFEIFDNYGADVLRWYFFSNQTPWNSINYSEQAIKGSIPEFMLRMWNTYSFFLEYAIIDGFDPAVTLVGLDLADGGKEICLEDLSGQQLACIPGCRPVADRPEMDRWIISELNQMLKIVVESMDQFENYPASGAINSFLDSLSNWYVRRSRDRFWSADKEDQSKNDAYWTLYECLVTLTKSIAPFVPFVAEEMWQNLSKVFEGQSKESVHLCDYPVANEDLIDLPLSRRMNLLREIASLGLRARTEAKLRVRQPLAKMEVVLGSEEDQPWLENHAEILKGELRIKEIAFTTDGKQYVDYQVIPNFPKLGPRYGKSVPKIKAHLAGCDGGELLDEMTANGAIKFDLDGVEVELSGEDIQIRLNAKDGWAAAQGKNCVAVLSTQLSDELLQEGLANDVIRIIQNRRKELGLQYTDRISVGLQTEDESIKCAVNTWSDHIKNETLAENLGLDAISSAEATDCKLDNKTVELFVTTA